jgi:hypothetical protein
LLIGDRDDRRVAVDRGDHQMLLQRSLAGRHGDRWADHRGFADRGGRRGGRDEEPWIAELRRISRF